MTLWETLAQVVATGVLLALGELTRRKLRKRVRPPERGDSLRPQGMREIPFARNSAERCLQTPDCVLIAGHDGGCYLTSWLFQRERRQFWRRARGEKEGD